MDFVRSIPAAALTSLVSLLIGCYQDSPPVQTSEETTRRNDVAAIVTDISGDEIELASATLAVPAADAAPRTPVVADAEITLRDANAATLMIARYFPIKDMELKYCGVLSDLDHCDRLETGSPATPESCWWEMARGGTEDSRITIHFELLAASRCEYDIPLQAGIDRVVFVHLIRCWDGDAESVPCEEFTIDGVEVVELFRRCDEAAMWHWEREKQDLLVWQRVQERERLQAASTADSEAPAPTSRIELAGGTSTSTNAVSAYDTDGLSSPVPVLRQLAFRRFICRPLQEMIDELQMTGPCLAGIIFGSPHAANSFWVSPQFPEHYIEVFYKNGVDGKTVMSIRLRDREHRE